MATTEHTINDALASILRKTRRAWNKDKIIRSENTGAFKGNTKRPDILIVEPSVSPVIIESEVLPAIKVETEARERLGEHLRDSGRAILSSIALRLPEHLRNLSGSALREELSNIKDFEMALFSGSNPKDCHRWPERGWITGSANDLSGLSQFASVPSIIVDNAAIELIAGITNAASILGELAEEHPGSMQHICTELKQEDDEQTRRMATTIMANAFVFQDSLAGGPGKLSSIKTLDELRNKDGRISKSVILGEWRSILKVNYWPIFDIARRILGSIPTSLSGEIIEVLATTAEHLLESQLMHSHDLMGALFQRLIADRKFLAAYYTTPASAALLVSLAIKSDETPGDGNWSNSKDVKKINIADFACGTGTLLSTAYQRIGKLHEFAGGDASALHSSMMAESLIGCDVLPAAAHLTASMLSGVHPTEKYSQSAIMTLAYGRQPDNSVALGSLELLDPQGTFEILSVTATIAGAMGKEEQAIWESLAHQSFDLIVMNPPFTRATGHEGKKIGVPNPMFAAFQSSSEEQRAMSQAIKKLTKNTSAHGNAGEASIFLVLADCKIKRNGTIAMVMPLSFISGDAWENSRKLLRESYSDLIIVSIVGVDGSHLSFSADTGMGECLVLARKAKSDDNRATFVMLNKTPASTMMGESSAKQIHHAISSGALHRIEEGPVSGTPISYGDDLIGHVIDAPLPPDGGWKVARIADVALAQVAHQLSEENRLWLPSLELSDAIDCNTIALSEIGQIGPYHMDVSGNTSTGNIRGPFDIKSIKSNAAPTYPVIWSHDAERERTIEFDGESEGIVRKGATPDEEAFVQKKIAQIWATASHCHVNRDFRFNSQSTAMQFTPNLTIGGHAWLSVILKSEAHEKALVVWANTTLGVLQYWWHANKQQDGRGRIGKAALHSLNVLDVTALNKKQLNAATMIFNEFSNSILKPVNEIENDTTRRELDQQFLTKVLGVNLEITKEGGSLELLRAKLGREPSIKGSKKV